MRNSELYEVVICQDKDTGVVWKEEWWLDGKKHRIGAPANIFRDRVTGEVIGEDWYFEGRLHRDDGPAMIRQDQETGIWHEADFIHGRRQRPPPMHHNDDDPSPIPTP